MTNPGPGYSFPYHYVYRHDVSDPEAGESCVEFRLTYQGKLTSTRTGEVEGRAENKHHIRKHFHGQLKKFWAVQPQLIIRSTAMGSLPSAADQWADEYAFAGFRFLPLVRDGDRQNCSIRVLYLRNGARGLIVSEADIDNRLKTLVDALRRPTKQSELPDKAKPETDQDPFYVLLADDKLITHLSVETDMLLDPFDESLGDMDSRVIIHVKIWPF